MHSRICNDEVVNMKVFFVWLICILISLAILGAVIFVSVRYWPFFMNPGWSYHRWGKSRAEGGNLMYLIILWGIGGVLVWVPLWVATGLTKEYKENKRYEAVNQRFIQEAKERSFKK